MRSADFWRQKSLERLDSPEAYLGPPRRLRLARVLRALMENPSRSAMEVLSGLTKQADFLDSDERQVLLIDALAAVRPPSSEALAYWEEHSQPDSMNLGVTIAALANNGSTEALAILERRMADGAIPRSLKIAWMHRTILAHRHERPMLQSCERMFEPVLAAGLHSSLIEALSDYREDWYGGRPPIPVAEDCFSRESRELLANIGRYALRNVALEEGLRRKHFAGWMRPAMRFRALRKTRGRNHRRRRSQVARCFPEDRAGIPSYGPRIAAESIEALSNDRNVTRRIELSR